MSTEKERWAKLAGLPKPTDKQQLDENFVGMGMVGNIFDREKEQYEDAFEHFLSERYEEKVEESNTTNLDKKIQDNPEFLEKVRKATEEAEKGNSTALATLMMKNLEEENHTTKVRDEWPSLSIDERVKLLLTVFDNTDMAEKMAEKDFNKLPDDAISNMRMDMLEEGETSLDNKNQDNLIILKNLTDKRNMELFNWMKSNLTTEPYNFGLLWLDGPLEGGNFGLQKNKFNQEDIPVLMQYLEDNGYL